MKKHAEFPGLFLVIFFTVMLSANRINANNPNWLKSSVNGNFYVLTPSMTWTDAEAWAQEWGGHLVTIRDRSEELWIREFLGINEKFWIGYNVIGRTHHKDNFYWISGENSNYSNWKDIQPDNSGGEETVTAMNDEPNLPGNPVGADGWNDLNSGHGIRGIAEIITDDELGLVMSCTGEVTISGSDPQSNQNDIAEKGDLIKVGDYIKTQFNSLMKAAFPAEQGSRNIEIYPESEVRIAETSSSSETTMEFFKGKLKSKVKGLPEGYYFEVTTPQAVCGVRGTEFIIEGDESTTKITVVEGSVEVTTPDGTESVTVNGNYAVQATNEGLGEPYPAAEYFAGGFGIESDPWIIETAEHLNHVRQYLGKTHQDKHFKQTAHIDLGESPWNEGEGWVPIGAADSCFYGHYDGNSKEIRNLYINRDTKAYQGLFGWNSGIMINMIVMDASVTDHGSKAGILAGLNDPGLIENCKASGIIQTDHEDGRIGGLTAWNSSTIKGSSSTALIVSKGVCAGGITGINSGGSVINCYAGGDVHSEAIQAGGLVGHNQAGGLITGCYTTGNTNGRNYVGGLVGSNLGENSTIDQSYSTGDVAGNDYVGGLVGIQVNHGRISDSHSLGAVHASGNWAGGLVGISLENASISNSFSYSNVYTEGSRAGGLCGSIEENSTIQQSYALGTVHAEGNWAGGLVGMCYDHAMISQSFSASDVYAEGYSAGGLCGSIEKNCTIINAYATGNVSGFEWAGGLAGWADSSQIINSYSICHVLSEYGINAGGLTGGGSETDIVHSYWNTETSGQITNNGGEGKNTHEMLSQANFTDWDFSDIWKIDEGSTYPYLQWQEEPAENNYPEEVPALIRVPSMFSTIQEGIDRAAQGNTVLVADGVYTGRGNLFLSFKGKDIMLKSENGPEHCTIDYQDGPEVGAAILFRHEETRESIMEGFTLINSPVALIIENASPTIRNNVFTNNASGIHCGPNSSPLIRKNNIVTNSGTAIVCDSSTAEITQNLISENGGSRFTNVMTTTYDRHQRPDKTYIKGRSEHGGIAATNQSSPTIQNNLILHNRGMDSGAIYADSTSSSTIVNNHILKNASVNGGSVFIENVSSIIANNLIAYAGSSESTAGLSRWYKDPLFMHFVYDGAKIAWVTYYFGFVNYGEPCEVSLSGCAGLGGSVWAETGERFWVEVRSEVDQFGHGGGLKADVKSDAGNFSITQTIAQYSGGCNRVSSKEITSYGISEGTAGAGITMSEQLDRQLISHNNVYGNSGANYAYIASGDNEEVEDNLTGSYGNIAEDPLLDTLTYELLVASPCIDAGTNDVEGLDMGDSDFPGNPRITDGNGDGHAAIDIGAFEFQWASNIYTITTHAGENGSITPTGEVEVEYGSKQVFTITPDEGFRLAYIRIDDTEINQETDENWDAESGQYTFLNVTEAHTIEVGFEDSTAIKDIADQNELKVYPNPAKNELWIEFNYQASDRPVILLQNLIGQTIKQVSVNETESVRQRISTNNLTPGIYLITVKCEQEFPVKKVMIDK